MLSEDKFKAKAEDKFLRTRTRINLQGRGQSFEDEDKFEARKSCVKQIKPVSVQNHKNYSPHHYTDETRSK